MIEFIILIIMVVLIALLVGLLFTSIEVFLINTALMVIIIGIGITDIKKKKMFSFYMGSAFVTALLFIFKDSRAFKFIFDFFYDILIIEIVQALLLIFLIAQLLRLIYDIIIRLAEKYKKGLAKNRQTKRFKNNL
ncbi:hypothetical protein J4209_04525 [Candidatus Woesearchaeota archaeon]|nr:hypothetical protein [Candidatus Woesearchaeota archaeon]